MNQISLIIAAVLVLVSVGFFIYASSLLRKINTLKTAFTIEHQPVNLEEILNAMAAKIRRLEDGQEYSKEQFRILMTNQLANIQKLGVVRFNSLADQGGNLSFSVALLDGEDNGIVVTNMHGRENSRTYTKALIHGGSETPLTEEEKQAVLTASTEWHKRVKSVGVI